MIPNAFIGKAEPPSEEELMEALGTAATAWKSLLATLATELGVTLYEWKSYSRKAGWSLRLLRGKRSIVWLSPCVGDFRVAYVLGEKAVAAARASDLPAAVLESLDSAVKYPEGTGFRLTVRDCELLPAIATLAAIKIAH